jgi:hypothetical protein
MSPIYDMDEEPPMLEASSFDIISQIRLARETEAVVQFFTT